MSSNHTGISQLPSNGGWSPRCCLPQFQGGTTLGPVRCKELRGERKGGAASLRDFCHLIPWGIPSSQSSPMGICGLRRKDSVGGSHNLAAIQSIVLMREICSSSKYQLPNMLLEYDPHTNGGFLHSDNGNAQQQSTVQQLLTSYSDSLTHGVETHRTGCLCPELMSPGCSHQARGLSERSIHITFRGRPNPGNNV